MDTRERFDEIADDICARDGDVTQSQMVGMPALKKAGTRWSSS